MVAVLPNSAELERLRRAIEAVSEDLDAIEQRPHLSLRLAAQGLNGKGSHGLESCVDHFAFALKRGTLAPSSSRADGEKLLQI